MPQLRGAAGQGRLIYLLNTTRKEVTLVWIYTHAEFEKRPPDKSLKRLLREIMESEEVSERLGDGETAEEEVREEESVAGGGSDS